MNNSTSTDIDRWIFDVRYVENWFKTGSKLDKTVTKMAHLLFTPILLNHEVRITNENQETSAKVLSEEIVNEDSKISLRKTITIYKYLSSWNKSTYQKNIKL